MRPNRLTLKVKSSEQNKTGPQRLDPTGTADGKCYGRQQPFEWFIGQTHTRNRAIGPAVQLYLASSLSADWSGLVVRRTTPQHHTKHGFALPSPQVRTQGTSDPDSYHRTNPNYTGSDIVLCSNYCG